MERWVDLQGPRSPALLDAVVASDADVLAFYPYLVLPDGAWAAPGGGARRAAPGGARGARPPPAPLRRAVRTLPGLRLPQPERAGAGQRALRRGGHAAGAARPRRRGAGPGGGGRGRCRRRCAAAFGVDDVPYLVCIGRVDDQKGTGMLWRFFRAYKQRHPGPLRLVFVGQVIDAPDPADDVVVTGMIDDADKWALLRGAEALVAPSPHESFSLTVIEALTAGVPVLVNAVLRRDAGALRAVGRRAVVRRLRRVRSHARHPDHRRRAAGDDAAQRSALRRGQLHLAGDPGPLLLVPGALHRPAARRLRPSLRPAGTGVP